MDRNSGEPKDWGTGGMQVYKCRMCGGNLVAGEQQGVGTCDSCGSTMTVPGETDERRVNLYNRANHFRMLKEFDKALSAYEMILNEDNEESEAHWGAVLSRYGIEYVEDPSTHKRMPTCNRMQAESVLNDSDYLLALEYAGDGYSRSLYEAEAKAISEIQRGILSISNKEDPYDVFICYKEQSESGQRTKDSAFAQDVYYQLKQEGYRVFFSRISLEDRLGQEYEPYIFSALNSAKVMVVVGTKPEYFQAVWVKNEWSRYLKLMKQQRSRVLIPCYRDMDPYELPEELSLLQSLDMAKIGFMQDLVRGIKKIVDAGKTHKDIAASNPNGGDTAGYQVGPNPLLDRAFIFLGDGEFGKAEEYLERVLDQDPRNAKAYFGKFLAERKCQEVEYLTANADETWFESNNYRKAVGFAQGAEKAEIEGYRTAVKERREKELEAERIRLEEEEQERLRRAEAERIRLEEEEQERLRRAEAERIRLEEEEQERLRRAEAERVRLEEEVKLQQEQEKVFLRKKYIWTIGILCVIIVGTGILTRYLI
ncbi:MAG: toll/interleukin-1 receptor domain-containing protein [Spirochaetia bacterium]|nr:toll/interleukin-1 receptor domain-containing protein [Spirochaetia bacterium]